MLAKRGNHLYHITNTIPNEPGQRINERKD